MATPEESHWKYLTIWEFRVRSGVEKRFEQVYGPEGRWAELFCGYPGYIRTELSRDLNEAGRNLTLDFWSSRQAYERFRDASKSEYAALDTECEELTDSEVEVGSFERVEPSALGA